MKMKEKRNLQTTEKISDQQLAHAIHFFFAKLKLTTGQSVSFKFSRLVQVLTVKIEFWIFAKFTSHVVWILISNILNILQFICFSMNWSRIFRPRILWLQCKSYIWWYSIQWTTYWQIILSRLEMNKISINLIFNRFSNFNPRLTNITWFWRR